MKEFREFVAKWIETGFEWYAKDPELVTKYRFGHDFNNDAATQKYKNPDFQASIEIKNVFCELIPLLIVHVGAKNESVDKLLIWLRKGELVEPYGVYDFYVRQTAWVFYHILKLENKLMSF